MKTVRSICILLMVAFCQSCKSSSSVKRMEAEPPQLVGKPLIVRDVVVNSSGDQLVLSFSEQMKYDPMLVVIMASFLESGPEGLVPIRVAPSSKWLTKAIGQMSDEDPQLLFEDVKGFKQLTVDLSYDSELIETRVFDDMGKEIKNANRVPVTDY